VFGATGAFGNLPALGDAPGTNWPRRLIAGNGVAARFLISGLARQKPSLIILPGVTRQVRPVVATDRRKRCRCAIIGFRFGATGTFGDHPARGDAPGTDGPWRLIAGNGVAARLLVSGLAPQARSVIILPAATRRVPTGPGD